MFRYALFFLTIPKPLKQYTLFKKRLSIPLINNLLQTKFHHTSSYISRDLCKAFNFVQVQGRRRF